MANLRHITDYQLTKEDLKRIRKSDCFKATSEYRPPHIRPIRSDLPLSWLTFADRKAADKYPRCNQLPCEHTVRANSKLEFYRDAVEPSDNYCCEAFVTNPKTVTALYKNLKEGDVLTLKWKLIYSGGRNDAQMHQCCIVVESLTPNYDFKPKAEFIISAQLISYHDIQETRVNQPWRLMIREDYYDV
jgi:hypothetical protein